MLLAVVASVFLISTFQLLLAFRLFGVVGLVISALAAILSVPAAWAASER